MLYEDLMEYKGTLSDDADISIRNKYAAEMAYYAVLEAAIERYGPEGSKDISVMHNDALGAARDEMAMRASDQGIVRYIKGSGGRVSGFSDGRMALRRLEGSMIRHLVRQSFLNCEAIRNMVSTNLCSTTYRDTELSEDEIREKTDEEILERTLDADNPESPFSKAVAATERAVSNLDGLADKYAPGMPVLRVTTDEDGRERLVPTGQMAKGLKISPLVPELRVLRRSGFLAAELNLTANQSKMKKASLSRNNPVLAYDPDKKRLYAYIKGMQPEDTLKSGIAAGISDYWRNAAMSVKRPAARGGSHTEVKQFINPGDVNTGMNRLMAFKMAHILSSHSYQELNEQDFKLIGRIFNSSGTGGTIFGDFEDESSGAAANATAYFDYIEHVCSKAEKHMQSHEFEAHLINSSFISKEDREGFLPLMWFTGERTSDYQRARRSGARYFAVYPYARYTPKRLDSGYPVMGDASPASYSGYVFTKNAHRGFDGTAVTNNPRTNPYVSGRLVTAEMCRSMKDVFDAFLEPGLAARTGVSTVRMVQSIRGTTMSDLTQFLEYNGSVRGDMILAELIKDMNNTKHTAAAAFRSDANRAAMRRVFDRFIEKQLGIQDPDGEPRTLDDAVWAYAANGRHGRDMRMFGSHLAAEMERCIVRELRAANGEDIDSFALTRHAFRAYVSEIIELAAAETAGKTRGEIAAGSRNTFADGRLQAKAGEIIGRMSEPEDSTLIKALYKFYGGESEASLDTEPEGTNKVILKANALRHDSTSLYWNDYEDMLALLSYSGNVCYEPNRGKSAAEVISNLGDGGPRAVIQLYSADAFTIDAGFLDEDIDDERLEPENVMGVADTFSDENLWFDSVFAPMGGPEDRTLEWMDKTYPNGDYDPGEKKFADAAIEHARFMATHPLQVAAMRRTAETLARTESEFSPSRLAITPRGLIYYTDDMGRPLFRIGPVTDETAYVMPCVLDASENTPGAILIDRPMKDENGWPVRDAQGMALTEKAWVRIEDRIMLDEDGVLMNEVAFGALDTKTFAGAGEDVVSNAFYGTSVKLRNYDGYYHESFTDRMSFATYHTAVLENLDRALALYSSGRSPDGAKAERSLTVMYTSVNGGSLRKAYRTNTQIKTDEALCAAAGKYMLHGEDAFPEEDREPARLAANMLAAQAREYRNRCVFAKVTAEQNIGLFNQARHLQQARVNQVIGELDRNNLLRTDCMGARAMVFQDNPYFDTVSTGTANRMGSVAYLSDGAAVDRLTGKTFLDPKAGPETRSELISLGITDVRTGGLDTRLSKYPGGQAVDRLQLSMNGIRKAVLYADNLKFAMINLGYNMEDGYVVAKRAARKLGHFREDGSFAELSEWDKIGDTQSGNKGVVAKIVDTDITDETEFMARFTYKFLHCNAFNHSRSGNGDAAGAVNEAISAWLRTKSVGSSTTIADYFLSLPLQNNPDRTIEAALEELRTVELNGTAAEKNGKNYRTSVKDDKSAELRAEIYGAARSACADLGYSILGAGAEPFNGSYRIEHASWRLFADNPGLDMAVTNVCVCTRSNPSILMHIDEALAADNAYIKEHEGDQGFDRDAWIAEHSESALAVRNPDGSVSHILGACGRTPVYVDCHYADDKNRDYNEAVRKAGRGYGMQEYYALMAKKSVDALVPYITANDPVLPGQAAKLNRRLMMNGYAFDLSEDGMPCVKVSELFNQKTPEGTRDGNPIALDMSSEDGIMRACSGKPGYVFVDMGALADRLISKIPKDAMMRDMDWALKRIGNQDFTEFLGLIAGVKAGKAGSEKAEHTMRDMFTYVFGQYGGAFALQNGKNAAGEEVSVVCPSADLGYQYEDDDSGKLIKEPVRLSAELDDGGEIRTAVPVFTSNREVLNSEGDVIMSVSDNRRQFSIFKALLGAAVADRLNGLTRGKDGRPYANREQCDDTAAECRRAAARLYAGVADDDSLSLGNMNTWLKKNLFRTTFPNSLTCVWHGDPALEIDEVGISFEKAKSLRLLTPKKGLSEEKLAGIPDTYEFMSERYDPLTDDDFLLVNRSPGQTTGCVRALRARIMGSTGNGIAIHPALAAIFDGDFDGDTVGVINPRTPEAMDADSRFEKLRQAAMSELKARMSMPGNIVNKAKYTTLEMFGENGGAKTVEHVHPVFIADNADLAVAMHNMSKTEGTGPACGYDIMREINCVTAMANITEQLRQCSYDYDNVKSKRISGEDAAKIAGLRLAKTGELMAFLDAGLPPDGTERDRKNAGEWLRILAGAKPIYEAAAAAVNAGERPEIDLKAIGRAENSTFRRLAGVYRDMTGYMTAPSLMTQGESSTDIMYNVVRDANISRKGKAPQLNALLQFAGMHETCARDGEPIDGLLSVGKADGEFRLMARHPDENGELRPMVLNRHADGKYRLLHNGGDFGEYEPRLKMSHLRATSDVRPTPFYSATTANIIAQSDKSDATGLGGSMAQRMQKVLGALGYGELALRISGPVTQKYLDAKQNVKDCDTNLKIGKAILGRVCMGAKINELQDSYIKARGIPYRQIYNGQYTIGGWELTVEQYVSQMDNFLQMMGHDAFSPIDKAQFEACMRHYEKDAVYGRGKTVGNPIREADETGDMVFASIYNNGEPEDYARILKMLRDTGRGLYSGSGIFDGHIDNELLSNRVRDSSKFPENSLNIDQAIDSPEHPDCAVAERPEETPKKDSSSVTMKLEQMRAKLERKAKAKLEQSAESVEKTDNTPPQNDMPDIVSSDIEKNRKP